MPEQGVFHKVVLNVLQENEPDQGKEGIGFCAKYFMERQKLSCLFWHIVMSCIVNVETVVNGLLIPGSNSCLPVY